MTGKRRKKIKCHLIEDELDEKLAEADDDEIVHRLTFLKNLYQGDLIEEAKNRYTVRHPIGASADCRSRSRVDE